MVEKVKSEGREDVGDITEESFPERSS